MINLKSYNKSYNICVRHEGYSIPVYADLTDM